MKVRQTNFGGNISWSARAEQPADEQAVLALLERSPGKKIRPVGSRHSWSDIAVSPDITLDMSRFDQIQAFEREGESFVRVGAGARLQALVDFLHERTDQTMPTLGAIKQQTISGAISTGTHGSGKQSLSHFVSAVRLAAFEAESGRPRIYELRDGEALRAARCGLGCMGVLLEVELKTIPRFKIRERVVAHERLDSVLGRYPDCPLTQFTLTPYRWDYLAFERAPVPREEESQNARLFRLYNTVGVDILFHLGLKASMLVGDSAIKSFLKLAPALIVKDTTRVDDAEKVLTLGHHYFRHEEMELFVAESKLPEAVEVLRAVTDVFAGEATTVSPVVEEQLRSAGLLDELMALKGSYAQHYPFFFRKVLPEDTLMSMTASTCEPSFSISVFNYEAPADRDRYGKFCDYLARSLHRLVGARLHWGKRFPLGQAEVEQSYPELGTFRAVCRKMDPQGVFRNEHSRRVLGLG